MDDSATTEERLDEDERALREQKKELEERRAHLREREGELEEREVKLSDREKSLDDKEYSLQRRGEHLEEFEESLEVRDEAQDERQRKLDEREIELDERLREIERREQEVANDCQAIRRRREKELRKELAELRDELKTELDEEIAAERKRRRTSLNDELETRREEVERDLKEQRQKADQLLETRTTELDEREEKLDERARELAEKRQSLQQKQEELEDRNNQLGMRERQLEAEKEFIDEQRNRLDEKAERLAAEEVAELEDRLARREERIEELQEELNILQSRLDSYDDWRRRFGQREPDEVLDRLKNLEQQLDEKRKELRKRPSREEKERLEQLETQRKEWEKRRRELTRELNEKRTRLNEHIREHGIAEQQRDLYEAEKRRRMALNATVEGLEEEVKRLQGIYEKPTERSSRVGSIEAPVESLTKRLEGGKSRSDQTELEWLEQIREQCEAIDFRVPRRLLHAFHTSLKTAESSPITVLAGVSGTGKSMLPRVYSHFGGLQFLDVPVRPDWDSPQSLFGFFNSIDNQFNATELLRAMVQASKSPEDPDFDGGFDDRMMLVLLDEMNLAHVELYFSDLLSKLESRRSSSAESIPIEMGAGVDPYQLELTDNVLWTGTMNQDATTKSLSDKVKDRSNMLFFPRPDEFIRRFENELGHSEPLLPKQTWEEWKVDNSPFSSEEIEDFKEGLENVNGRLEKVGRALGHRVWQSVEQYMLNYPTVIEAREEMDAANAEDENGEQKDQDSQVRQTLESEMKNAFEDQVVQKVMPKLRGIETRGRARNECLDPIREILVDELNLELERDFDQACETGQGRFVWNSAHYITGE